MQFKFLSMILIIVSTLFVISCETTKEDTKVKLALDWYPNANHTGLYIALAKGYFKDENIDLEIYTPSDPSTVLQTVGAGQDDFGISYQPDLILAKSKNIPVKSVLAFVQHPLNIIMTLKESNIIRPSDLKGKKIAYPGIPLNENLLDTLLKADGLKGKEEVELINTGYDLVPPLIGKTVDACLGCYLSHETIMAENEGFPVNIMRMEQWGVPDYYELVLVASDEMVTDNKDLIERMIRAISKGYNDAVSDPKAGIDNLIKSTNGEIDQAIEYPGAELLAPLWVDNTGKFGSQTEEKWSVFSQWLFETGQITTVPETNSLFTNEFVK
ncbi:MAG: pyrimidine biosynthesis enzyme [Chloroflexi bacterium]|nr:pyrimidine biosynthesis enzyme [Chloroflexota bacterium]